MSDSGRGNSFNLDSVSCLRYGYWKQIIKLDARGEPAVPLIVGEAAHAAIAAFYSSQMGGAKRNETVGWGQDVFEQTLTDLCEGSDDTYEACRERADLARTILPVWAEQQWPKLESGVERTLAVEWDYEYELPGETPYGNILPALRRVTGRVDRVYSGGSGSGATVQDFKTTSAVALSTVAQDYLMSDQHLGYVYGWNRFKGIVDEDHAPGPDADTFVYSLIRLHKSINDKSFHDAQRLVSDAQLADYYERMCALRAHLSYLADKPKEMYWMNTAPSGPCAKYGRTCEYIDLCQRPNELDVLIGEHGDTGAPYWLPNRESELAALAAEGDEETRAPNEKEA